MPSLDPDVGVIARLIDQRLSDQETIRRQRRTIWALVAALRSQQVASASLADLADFLLAGSPDA